MEFVDRAKEMKVKYNRIIGEDSWRSRLELAEPPKFCCEDMKNNWELGLVDFGEISKTRSHKVPRIVLIYNEQVDPEDHELYYTKVPIHYCPFCGLTIVLTQLKEFKEERICKEIVQKTCEYELKEV